MLHLALHFIIPLLIAFLFFKENWKISYLTMLGTMLVDLDHILATPIYDATVKRICKAGGTDFYLSGN